MKKWVILLIIVLLCRILSCIYIFEYKYVDKYSEIININVIIVDKFDEKEEYVVYRIRSGIDYFLLRVNNKQNNINIGETINISCKMIDINNPKNLGEFNYKRYLNSNGIVAVMNLYSIRYKVSENKVISKIGEYRKSIDNLIRKNLDEKESDILKSIIYGEKYMLDDGINEKFKNLGLSHILCVSGTHIVYFLSVFSIIIGDKKKNKVVYILALIYFLIITSFSYIILRAVIAEILVIIFPKLGFRKKMVISFTVICFINPYCIFNAGIILSLMSIIGIKMYNNLILSYFKVYIFKLGNKNTLILGKIIGIASQSISSQILSIPFQIYYFNKIVLISIISNIIIYPFLSLVLSLGFLLFISLWIPSISVSIFFVINILLKVFIFVIEYMDKIGISSLKLPAPNMILFVCYYFIILSLYFFKYTSLIKRKNRKLFRSLIRFSRFICILVIIVSYIYVKYFETYVYFFYVEQGNMALIHNGKITVLVDAGSTTKNKAGNILKNFLDYKGINNIDLVLITHMHDDHTNGISKIVEEGIKIGGIVYSVPYDINIDEYIEIDNIIRENNINRIEVYEGDNLKLDEIEVNVLSPPKSNLIDEDMLNVNSTVYLISMLNNMNYLFMGDSTKITEKYILSEATFKNNELIEKINNLIAYQVSHHGSNTSSDENFIKNINSCIAIISAKKSVYGHPSEEVLQVLNKYKFNIKLLEKEGAIMI